MNEITDLQPGELCRQAVRDVMNVERRCLELKAKHKEEIKCIRKGAIEAARRHGVNIKAIQQIVKMLAQAEDIEIGSFMRTLEYALRIEGIAYPDYTCGGTISFTKAEDQREEGNE